MIQVFAVDRPEVPPLAMPDRFRHDVTYFMTPAGEPGMPPLGKGEYWIKLAEAQLWLENLTIAVVSPLDSASKAEIELSEEQEAWLEWLIAHGIQHVRLG